MGRRRVSSLAVCAFVLAGLSSAGAFGQIAQTDQNGNVLPSSLYPPQGVVASDQAAGPLFRFSALSNKSGFCGSPAGRGRPKVVATFPANGTTVQPGILVVRVTFDQPMSCDASFEGHSDLPNPCPGRWREVTLSQDRRSFRTVCEVKANTRYRLTLHSFRNSRGLAAPADVAFATSGAAPVATIQQAMAEDTAFSGPVG